MENVIENKKPLDSLINFHSLTMELDMQIYAWMLFKYQHRFCLIKFYSSSAAIFAIRELTSSFSSFHKILQFLFCLLSFQPVSPLSSFCLINSQAFIDFSEKITASRLDRISYNRESCFFCQMFIFSFCFYIFFSFCPFLKSQTS